MKSATRQAAFYADLGQGLATERRLTHAPDYVSGGLPFSTEVCFPAGDTLRVTDS